MTENEKNFIRTVVDYDSNIKYIQNELKNNFSIDSTFDEDNATISMHGSPENIMEAKKYIEENFLDTPLNIEMIPE